MLLLLTFAPMTSLMIFVTREFCKRLQQWQLQRQKSMIWLAETGKIIVLHVQRAFKCIPSAESAKWLGANSHMGGFDDKESPQQ